jgi:putative RecB family exonuclease
MDATTYDSALATFNKHLDDAKAAKPDAEWRAGGRRSKAYPNKEDESWWRVEGPQLVHNYAVWRDAYPNMKIWRTPQGTPAIELAINLEISEGVYLKCFIDRVFEDSQTGDLIIVDLKTGKTPSNSLQLAIYRLAIFDQFGIDIPRGAYWMAREGALDTIHNLNILPIETVRRWCVDVYDQIHAGKYVPNLSQACGYCDVRDHCYAWNPALTPDSYMALPIVERETSE